MKNNLHILDDHRTEKSFYLQTLSSPALSFYTFRIKFYLLDVSIACYLIDLSPSFATSFITLT